MHLKFAYQINFDDNFTEHVQGFVEKWNTFHTMVTILTLHFQCYFEERQLYNPMQFIILFLTTNIMKRSQWEPKLKKKCKKTLT